MTNHETAGPGGGERWNVNLPAVIGVVFVFLVGIVVWVIASGAGDETVAPSPRSDPTGPAAAEPVDTAPLTTTPAMPDLTTSTLPAPTSTPTSVPESTTTTGVTTTVPVTAAPGAGGAAVPGDLGIPGRPMQRPPCEGEYITIFASAIGDEASADGIAGVLEAYPGTEYLRTDQTCSSLRPEVDGEPIYVVYRGPFAFAQDACTARADGPEGAYAKQLSDDVPPDQVVACG